jgi:Flp pilus assembly protein TadG
MNTQAKPAAAKRMTMARLLACARRRRVPKSLRSFASHNRGAAAVEFALVMLPFVALLFGIIQTAIVFFASQVLETAVSDSARLILTGQAQNGGYNLASFKTAVCAKITSLFNCQNNMYIDVRTYADFAAISMTSQTDANGNLINNFVYQPGGPGDIVVVRLLYPWPLYMQLWNSNISNMAGSNRLLIATAAFRNEPY